MGYFYLAWPFPHHVDLAWDILTSYGAFSIHVNILTTHGAFSPCEAISPSMGHFHLVWPFLPRMDILNLHGVFSTLVGHFHLIWGIFTLCGKFPPHMGHFHLARGIFTLHGHFLLVWGIFTSHGHLICTSIGHPHLVCSLPHQNIFQLTWKNSQNSDKAIPIPSIRCLYEPPKMRT